MRYLIPILGLLAMAAMFLKMPATPPLFGCKYCSSGASYVPLFGAIYFAALTAISILFRSFPSRTVAKGGLVWAATLAAAMTFFELPKVCALCLFAHACHILMWTIWLVVPARVVNAGPYGKKIALVAFAPICAAVLFIGINHTLKKSTVEGLQIGDALPGFSVRTIAGRSLSSAEMNVVVLNFIATDCPYCQEQQEKLKEFLPSLSQKIRFVNVSPLIPGNLNAYAPNIEWVADPDQKLLELFQVAGYPTLFVAKDGKIIQVVLGVPDHLKAHLSIIF